MVEINIIPTKKKKIRNLITKSKETGWELTIKKQTILYAILKDKETIGFVKGIKLKGNPSMPITQSFTDISHIWITPEEQRKGFGTSAVSELIKKIPDVSFNDPSYELIRILEKLEFVKPIKNSFISKIPLTIYGGAFLGLPEDAAAFTLIFYHGKHDYLVFPNGDDPVLVPVSMHREMNRNSKNYEMDYVEDRENFLKTDNKLLRALVTLMEQENGF